MIILPGINYLICYDEEGLPDIIIWMTPEIKYNIVHYGDTMLLDAQMRQYIQFNWPYIGIMIKGGEFKGGLTSESIRVVESLDIYN